VRVSTQPPCNALSIGADEIAIVIALSTSSGRLLRRVARVIAIVVVLGGIAWTLRGIDAAALGDALSHATLWPILVAAAINFGLIGCKAIAWKILLGRVYPVSVRRLFSYTITSCAASMILPLRAGELVRVWLLRDRDGVPVTHTAAVAMAEKLLDIVSMLVLVAPLPWLVDDLPASLSRWIGVLAIGVIAALIVLRVAAGRLPRHGWLARFVDAFSVVHRPRIFAATVAVLVLGWLIDLAMIMLVLHALGIELSLGAGLFVLFAINVTIAIPSTPGQVGALELGAVLALRLAGVSDEQSLAFALLYHALQLIPVAVAGLTLNARAIVAKV
jgi:uncharacterized membrane protein YbhN (UPF0104 family)